MPVQIISTKIAFNRLALYKKDKERQPSQNEVEKLTGEIIIGKNL